MFFSVIYVFVSLTNALAKNNNSSFLNLTTVNNSVSTIRPVNDNFCLTKNMVKAFRSLSVNLDHECFSYHCEFKDDWSNITVISCEKPVTPNFTIMCYTHKYRDVKTSRMNSSPICCSKESCVMVKPGPKIIKIPGQLIENLIEFNGVNKDMKKDMKIKNDDPVMKRKMIKKRETVLYMEERDILNSHTYRLYQKNLTRFAHEKSTNNRKSFSRNIRKIRKGFENEYLGEDNEDSVENGTLKLKRKSKKESKRSNKSNKNVRSFSYFSKNAIESQGDGEEEDRETERDKSSNDKPKSVITIQKKDNNPSELKETQKSAEKKESKKTKRKKSENEGTSQDISNTGKEKIPVKAIHESDDDDDDVFEVIDKVTDRIISWITWPFRALLNSDFEILLIRWHDIRNNSHGNDWQQYHWFSD